MGRRAFLPIDHDEPQEERRQGPQGVPRLDGEQAGAGSHGDQSGNQSLAQTGAESQRDRDGGLCGQYGGRAGGGQDEVEKPPPRFGREAEERQHRSDRQEYDPCLADSLSARQGILESPRVGDGNSWRCFWCGGHWWNGRSLGDGRSGYRCRFHRRPAVRSG